MDFMDRQRRVVLWCNLALFLSCGMPAEAKARQELPSRSALTSMETADSSIRGLLTAGKDIYLMPSNSQYVLKTQYDLKEKDPLKRFSDLGKTTRHKLPNIFRDGQFTGMSILQNKMLLLDGKMMNTATFDLATMELVSKHSIVYDLLRPPPDRGGEATKKETAELRTGFVKSMTKVLGNPVNGMAELPKSWWPSKKPSFLLLSAAASYPFLIMECTSDDLSRCMISRACFAKGVPAADQESLRGLAIHKTKKLVMVGNAKKHRVEFFKFSSCMNISKLYSRKLPPRIKNISSVHLDADNSLWIASTKKDDYFNASVFFWAPKEWLH